MVTAEMAEYPLPRGTLLVLYTWPEKTLQQDANGAIRTATLNLVDGTYVLHESGSKNDQRFRLDQIGESPHYLVMSMLDPAGEIGHGAVYSLITTIDGFYVSSNIDATDFEKYESWLRINDPDRLSRYAATYLRNTDGGFTIVVFRSYEVLKSALAEMAALGFHKPQTGYEPSSPEHLATLEQIQEVDEELARLYQEQAELDEASREFCGGRVCRNLQDGRTIYRTDTYDPPMWYFRDGRLAPRELWPPPN